MLRIVIATGVGALALISVLLFLFMRSGETPSSGSWGNGAGLFSPESPSTLQRPEPVSQGGGVDSLGVIPLPQQQQPQRGQNEPDGFAAGLADLLAKLTEPPQTATADAELSTPLGYSFIPQGLISIQTSGALSPEQAALYEYGNAVGSSLAAFASLHPDMPQTLKDQAEDRSNAVKGAALKRLASDFVTLGDTLSQITPPPTATNIHAALVAAYRDVGTKLAPIADAQGDQAFLNAIYTYNSAAETLSKQLVGLADLFGTYEVTFSSSDAGSIFIFSGGASL